MREAEMKENSCCSLFSSGINILGTIGKHFLTTREEDDDKTFGCNFVMSIHNEKRVTLLELVKGEYIELR
ncbi:hypothetical protein MAR_012153 [Mya arenaria]|uniref:Uncharacterized protein n=1 Tax=Mya arenaria TaxID=6604 RepID=A0ABY7FZR7_MYAAR|nr:hypothetical protein MAR_012153 [Mya arenaria]